MTCRHSGRAAMFDYRSLLVFSYVFFCRTEFWTNVIFQSECLWFQAYLNKSKKERRIRCRSRLHITVHLVSSLTDWGRRKNHHTRDSFYGKGASMNIKWFPFPYHYKIVWITDTAIAKISWSRHRITEKRLNFILLHLALLFNAM